jgi:hypothetical protein
MFRLDGEVFLLGTAIAAPSTQVCINKNGDDLRLIGGADPAAAAGSSRTAAPIAKLRSSASTGEASKLSAKAQHLLMTLTIRRLSVAHSKSLGNGDRMHRCQSHNGAFAATLVFGVAIVLFFEWHTDEPLVVLPVLLLACLIGGWAAPSRQVAVGVTLGASILCAHALSVATGTMAPAYQKQPPLPEDWLAMCLLVLPSMAAAWLGSRAAKLMAAYGN